MPQPHRITTWPKRCHGLLGCVALALIVAGVPKVASAGSRARTPATVFYDVVIERPLGLVELATGVGITAVAWPIAAAMDDGDLVVDQCVRTPTRSTFTRALGRLDDDRRSHCSPVAFSIELTQLTVGTALKPLVWIFGGSPFSKHESDDDGIEI